MDISSFQLIKPFKLSPWQNILKEMNPEVPISSISLFKTFKTQNTLQNIQFEDYASLQDHWYNTLHGMMETQNTNLENFQSAFMARFPPNQPVEPPQDNEGEQH